MAGESSEAGRRTPRQVLETTQAGVLRGAVGSGIHAFRGIRYGESTGGSNAFPPPVKAAPWSGVRDALAFGPDAPQNRVRGQSAALQNNPALAPCEDCLVLNVWTQGLGDGADRPVLFWCHGGGFVSGSGSAWDPVFYPGGER